MKIYSPVKILIFLTIVGLSASPVWSRASIEINNKDFQTGLSSGDPAHAIVAHRIGQLVLSVNNNGTFGTGFASSVKIDYFTGQATPSCEF
ncbi:MAG: hypothetical protein ACE5D6_03925, partial [Candidatus Zixiibacteriota bacterium]